MPAVSRCRPYFRNASRRKLNFCFHKEAMEEAKQVTGQDRLFGISRVRTSSNDWFFRIIVARDIVTLMSAVVIDCQRKGTTVKPIPRR